MQIEATGKSVEIAIQNGLLECGMKREDVEVQVLDEGGMFKKAKVLLEKSDLNISEIAYSIGIDDPLNFSRFFKHIVGVSPRKYRENLK